MKTKRHSNRPALVCEHVLERVAARVYRYEIRPRLYAWLCDGCAQSEHKAELTDVCHLCARELTDDCYQIWVDAE